jgi:hypothetical protein
MPTIPWLTWSHLRVPLLLLVGVVVVGGMWISVADRFYVWQPRVEGAQRTAPAEVVEVSQLVGLHIVWVRPAQIEARLLEALPTLESAQVSCNWRAECTISIVERQPRIVWDQQGKLVWIDAEGVVFPAQGVAAEGWVVRGPLPVDEAGHLDERVHVALTELWEAEAAIAPLIYYVPGRGLMLTDEHGWRIVVGEGRGMARRLEVLRQLSAHLEAQGIAPRFVDVRFPEAPYYSLTNDW